MSAHFNDSIEDLSQGRRVKPLLDTDAFLWLVSGSPNLSPDDAAALANPVNEPFLSIVSTREPAIKTTTPRRQVELDEPLDLYVARWSEVDQIQEFAIRSSHVRPLLSPSEHHRDPFDRFLIAQAVVEDMTLVSVDE